MLNNEILTSGKKKLLRKYNQTLTKVYLIFSKFLNKKKLFLPLLALKEKRKKKKLCRLSSTKDIPLSVVSEVIVT